MPFDLQQYCFILTKINAKFEDCYCSELELNIILDSPIVLFFDLNLIY